MRKPVGDSTSLVSFRLSLKDQTRKEMFASAKRSSLLRRWVKLGLKVEIEFKRISYKTFLLNLQKCRGNLPEFKTKSA